MQGPGAKFSQRAPRAAGKSLRARGPGAQRRPWPCAQRTAGHNRRARRQKGCRVGPAGPGVGSQTSWRTAIRLTRASVLVSPVWRMSPSHFRGESSIRPGNSWISNVIYELGVVSRLGLARRGRRAHGRPALYTNTSMRPNRRTVALTADAGRLVMDNRDARAVRALTPYLAATAPTSQPMKYPQRSPDSPIRESTARPAPSGGPEFALRSTARWGPNWSPAQ